MMLSKVISVLCCTNACVYVNSLSTVCVQPASSTKSFEDWSFNNTMTAHKNVCHYLNVERAATIFCSSFLSTYIDNTDCNWKGSRCAAQDSSLNADLLHKPTLILHRNKSCAQNITSSRRSRWFHESFFYSKISLLSDRFRHHNNPQFLNCSRYTKGNQKNLQVFKILYSVRENSLPVQENESISTIAVKSDLCAPGTWTFYFFTKQSSGVLD